MIKIPKDDIEKKLERAEELIKQRHTQTEVYNILKREFGKGISNTDFATVYQKVFPDPFKVTCKALLKFFDHAIPLIGEISDAEVQNKINDEIDKLKPYDQFIEKARRELGL